MVNAATLAGMTSPVYVPTSQEIDHLIATVERSAKDGDGYADLTCEPILALCGRFPEKLAACNALLSALPVTGGGVWTGPSIEHSGGNTPSASYRVNIVTHPLYVSIYKQLESKIEAALLSAAAQGYHVLNLLTLAPLTTAQPPYFYARLSPCSPDQSATFLLDAKNELQANGYAVQRKGDSLEVSW